MEFAKKGLEIKKNKLGENHISTAISYDNISYIYREMNELKLAYDMMYKNY